jgi:hypothetical protein
MSEMSMSSETNPETAQANEFSSGHQSGHHEYMKSSLPNKCPNPDPLWEKGFTPPRRRGVLVHGYMACHPTKGNTFKLD